MSVKRTILTLAVFGLALASSSATAQRETREKLISPAQLENDDVVYGKRTKYRLAASALYISEHCGKELGQTPEQSGFIKKQFDEISTSYFTALDQAFVKRTNSYSTPEWKRKYVDYMSTQQQPVVDQTAKAIQTKGCDDSTITAMLEYYDKLRKSQAAPTTPTASDQPAASVPTTPALPTTEPPPANVAAPAEPSIKKE